MRHRAVIALTLLVIFAGVNFTSALVGQKLTKYCKQSMGNANTHQVFCRAISNRVTLKAYKVCRKAVTYACKGAKLSMLVEYKECKATLLRKICPDVDALSTTVAPGDVEAGNEDAGVEEIEEDEDFPEDDESEEFDDDSEEIDFDELLRQTE